MSKIVFLCYKDAVVPSSLKNSLEIIASRLVPDNITPNPPRIESNEGVIYSIVNPVSALEEKSGSVVLGQTFDNEQNWWEVGAESPDGSYAIFRSDSDNVELLTDVVGSRSIWYYQNESVFIASTSQRAIVSLLGSFEPNKNALPWVLSTGGIGPGNSWDARIKLLPPDSKGILNRLSWLFVIEENPIVFSALNKKDSVHEQHARQALNNTFAKLKIDFKKWVLPLSGGYDSRGILCLFNKVANDFKNLKTITWGLKSAAEKKGNDAYVAKELADHYKINHKYYHTDLTDEPIERVLNRYLVCSEGRVDHIGGYLDGFKIWKTLFEDGVEGVIRGDVGFSPWSAKSAAHIQTLTGLSLCSDFVNLRAYESFGMPKQQLPENLQLKTGESLATYRERIYHQYRIPVILAALNDLKVSFVEIINPLLSRKIIYHLRQTPDHLRTDKVLFKKIVNSLSPKIAIATSSATANSHNVLKSKEVVKLFRDEFSSGRNAQTLAQQFLDTVAAELKVKGDADLQKSSTLKSIIKRIIPNWVRMQRLYMTKNAVVDPNMLGFRTYTICKMYQLLNEDAQVLKPEIAYQSSVVG